MNKRFRFVTGYVNAAVYDLGTGKVFSINLVGRNIIEKFLAGQNISDGYEYDFISRLAELGMNRGTLFLDKECLPYQEDKKEGLRYAWLELTEKCNCNCVHCYGQWGDEEKNKHKWMDKENWLQIIDAIYASGGRDIQLIGGEPLLYPDFQDILHYAHTIGMQRIDVFTNATLIDEQVAETLKRNEVSVRVSLYGHCAEVHDKVTQHKGSFRKTSRGLKLLKEYNIPTRIAVVIMDINQDYVEEIKSFIESIGYEFQGYDTIRQAVYGNQLSHCVNRVDVLSEKYQKSPRFVTKESVFEQSHLINSCWNRKLAFAASGDVYPCIFARDFKIGNVFSDSFEAIWENARIPWHYNIDMVEECRGCEFRYACGDCRPLAKSLSGKENGKYPRCTYNPRTGTWDNVAKITNELKKNTH